MNASYKYELIVNNVSREVYPLTSKDISIDYTAETSQRFFRKNLNGKLTFIKDDAQLIINSDIETKFGLKISINKSGINWDVIYTGQFYKTDCEIDVDSLIVRTKVDVDDEYVNILANLDTEYDLAKLSIPKIQVSISKRPLIQIYIPGDTVVGCFLGGNYWEEEATQQVTDNNQLINTYKFAKTTGYNRLSVSGDALVDGSSNNLLGEYAGVYTTNDYISRNAIYKMSRSSYPEEDELGQITGRTVYAYSINRRIDNLLLFEGENVDNANYCILYAVNDIAEGIIQVNVLDTLYIYMRYLLDVDIIAGHNTYPIPDNDIVTNNRNYRKVIGYAIDTTLISYFASDEPTPYGITPDGKYYMPPYILGVEKLYPISRSNWGYNSYWFNPSNYDWIFDEEGRKSYNIRDGILLSDAISVIINSIDSNVSHEATSEYSDFLYNPNSFFHNNFSLILTPKSNIIKGEYDKPAQKAIITLNDIFNMLRDCFRCYWFIENGKLRIEHIEFFRKGKSYSGNNTLLDINQLINTRNDKSFAYNTNKYTYDKIDLPEKYVFKWMDSVTESFEGYPIIVRSNYVTKGKKEEINVSKFTTDIDYILLNPDDINEDGFALMAATSSPNLLDRNDPDIEYGSKISPVDGTTIRDVLRRASGYIPVNQYAYYAVSNNDTYAIYDENKNYITGGYSNNIIQIPANGRYIRVSIFYTNWDTYVIKQGQTLDKSYILPFIELNIDGVNLTLQNGLLSFINLHDRYYRYDLPSYNVQINKEINSIVFGIERKKKQKIQIPSINNILDPLKLITTGLGNGQIAGISLNLYSDNSKIDLVYDTE